MTAQIDAEVAARTESAAAGITSQLAEFVATVRPDAVPEQVMIDAKVTVLDWLANALAGAHEPPARMAQQVAAGFGASTEATLFAAGRASAVGAAFANGVASHILELDDVHKGSTLHGAAPIIPAALAIAEREGSSGSAFLTAVVLGYDAALRIGEAVNPSHYRMWHPTGTVATFGAAVAAGHLVGLDSTQMRDALGSAGTQASGLWEFNTDGTMSKTLHPGKAALNGILAADLARLGFSGAATILEGERGFIAATSAGDDIDAVLRDLGSVWKISENCFKLHACCGHTHTSIDLALAARAAQAWSGPAAVDAIRNLRVDLYGPGYEIVSEMRPRTPYQAKFSLAYVVAAALLEGQVGLEQFDAARFNADGVTVPAIADLLERTQVGVDPAFTAQYPQRWPARLTIELLDDTVLTDVAEYPAGNPENPAAAGVLEAKARNLIAPLYGDAVAERAVAAVGRLEEYADMRTFMQDILG